MIRVRGNIEESDYLSAQHLHSRARRAIAVVGVALVAIGVVIAVMNIIDWHDGSMSAVEAMQIPFLVALLSAYLFVFRPWSFRRTYRKYPALHEPVSIDISEEGLAYSSAHGQGEIPWRLFIKWREGRRLFLIYSAPNLFHIIPMRLLENGGARELRELLADKLGHAA